MFAARIAGLGSGLLLLCAARAWGADARCPASFATARGACDARVTSGAQPCAYPEGKCTCMRSTPCSGVPMPPGEPRWRCQAARRTVARTKRPRRAAPVPHRARRARTATAARSRTRATRRTGPGSFRAAPRRRPAWPEAAAPMRCPTRRGRLHCRRTLPSLPPRPRRARRGKPVPRARPSAARRAVRARRPRPARRCRRCAVACRAARRRVACSSRSKPRAGGPTVRGRVGSAARPRASPPPLRRAGCDQCSPGRAFILLRAWLFR